MKKITLKEASKILGITNKGVLRWCRLGTLKNERCECGISLLVSESDILNIYNKKRR